MHGASICIVTVPASAGFQPFELRRTCAAFGESPPSLLPLPPGCFTIRAELRGAPPFSFSRSSSSSESPSDDDSVLLVESPDATVQVRQFTQ